MIKFNLPVLGEVWIRECETEPGHYLWWNRFGWSDCNRLEDQRIRNQYPHRQSA